MTKFSEWILNPGTAGPSIVEGMRRLGIPRPQSTEAQARAGTDTTTDMSPLRVTQNVNVRTYSIEAFRSAGASDRAALQAYMDTADPDARCVLQPGQTYLFDGGVTAVNRPVDICASGARLVRTAGAPNEPVISVAQDYLDVTPVTSLTVAQVNFGGGNSSVSRIFVGSGAAITLNVSIGDVVKIVSDDLIPSYSVGDGTRRIGEYGVVSGVGADYIDISNVLREAFTTNIRVARMQNFAVSLYGLNMSDAVEYPSARDQPMVQLTGCVSPVIVRPLVHDTASVALQYQGCYNPRTVGPTFDSLRTSPGVNAFGYGVREVSCQDGYHSDITGRRARHLFTTNAFSTSEDDARIWRYGGCIGSVAFGSASDCEAAAWDTHEDALNVRFPRVTQSGMVRGPETAMFAVSLRGRRCFANVDSDGQAGVRVLLKGNDGGHTIRVRHTRQPGFALADGLVRIDGSGAPTREKVALHVDLTVQGGLTPVIQAINAEVAVSGHVAMSYDDTTGTPARVFDLSSGSSVTADELDVDLTGVGSGALNPRIARINDNGSSFFARRVCVRRGAGNWILGDFQNTDGSITFNRLEYDTPPSSGGGGFSNVGAAAIRWVQQYVQNGKPLGQGSFVRSPSTLTDVMTVQAAGTQILSAPISAERFNTEPIAGVPEGHEIRYVRTAAATGAFSWTIGNDALTSENTWLTRKFVSGSWMTVAKGTL